MEQMNHENPQISKARSAALLRDLAVGLKQQMFFWGKDVLHPQGNLLVRNGFTKRASEGLQGTSCYGMDWRNGRIELHGACAGWYSLDQPGFLYIRPFGKCFTWSEHKAAIPGHWAMESLSLHHSLTFSNALLFIAWWLDYEKNITENLGPTYRAKCFREYKKLPKSKTWLRPDVSIFWLEKMRSCPENLKRARHFIKPI